MNTCSLLSISLTALLLAGQLPAAPVAQSKPSVTNATALAVTMPKSSFNLDDAAKDPFFPLTTYPKTHQVVTNVAPAAVSASSFQYKGVSGAGNNRLVLINNHNFAEGESDDVNTIPSGRARIRVVKIKDFSVVIQVEGQGETIEIFLPKDAR